MYCTLVLGITTGCSGTSTDYSNKYNINLNWEENLKAKTYVDFKKDYLIKMTNNCKLKKFNNID